LSNGGSFPGGKAADGMNLITSI